MANDLNHVVLIGRLVRDMETKYSSGGMAIGRFSLAVNRKKKQGDQWVEEVSYIDCVVFGKTAETLGSYLVKGKQVAVEGELHQNRWEQDGQSRSKIEINANNVQLLGGGEGQSAPRNTPPKAPAMAGDAPPDFPDDVPTY